MAVTWFRPMLLSLPASAVNTLGRRARAPDHDHEAVPFPVAVPLETLRPFKAIHNRLHWTACETDATVFVLIELDGVSEKNTVTLVVPVVGSVID